MPLISIIILNYNGKHHLQDCFDSIFSQNFTDFEIILTDNNSTDQSVSWIKENYPKVKIVENKNNLGFAGGNNSALPYASGQWLFFLNNDTMLENNCLAEIAKGISEREPNQLVFAPLIVNFDDPAKIDSGGDCLYPWCYGYRYEDLQADNALFAEKREITLACGGAAIFNKELFNKIDGFDEDFFLIYEDVDLSFKAKKTGAKIWMLPKAKVRHKGYATITQASAQRMYFAERNRFYLKIKHYPFITLLKYSPQIFIFRILSMILWISRRHFLLWLKAHVDVLRNMPKILKKRQNINRKDFESWLRKENFFKWLFSIHKHKTLSLGQH
ncbi:MAG: glycosyltransferase family 2 protein [Fibromonadales bacterium]|nr:glycosyltransferase family 2 protein [Fibromonadales bacterium]